MPLTLTIAAYFIAAALLAVGRARLGRALLGVAIAPFALQLAFVVIEATTGEAGTRIESIAWLPSLGVSFDFRIDALTLVLTSVVATVGLLIVTYSASYLTDPEKRVRFLALMVLFTGGMAGIVASDNLFGLFVFWEVTTVALTPNVRTGSGFPL